MKYYDGYFDEYGILDEEDEEDIGRYLYEIERAERKRIAEIEYNNEIFDDLEDLDDQIDEYYSEDY